VERSPPKTPDRANVNRIIRGCCIKVLPGRPALFGKNVRHIEIEGRIANRHGHDPLARSLAAGKFGDLVLDVTDRAHTPKGRENIAQRFTIHVRMAVDLPFFRTMSAGRTSGVGSVRGGLLCDAEWLPASPLTAAAPAPAMN
jgi:hypothetical protein